MLKFYDSGGMKGRELRIEREEWVALLISFLYFFCILASYYVMRPLREELAAEVGSSQLPWFFTATFIATIILTPIFSEMVSLWPRWVVIPLVYTFFIAGQLFFILLFIEQDFISTRLLGMMFFVWVSVFNLFVVSIFWSFMTDIWSDRQARRLFPIIGLGGVAGAIVGPILTRSLVGIIGIAPLLLVSALFLVLAVVCVLALSYWARLYGVHRYEADSEAAVGDGMFEGFKQVGFNWFIRNMAILMVLTDAIGTIAYALVIDYAGATFPNDAIARTRFAATVDLSTNTLQVIVQIILTPWLLIRYGARTVFVLCAAASATVCLCMAWSGDPYTPLIGSMPWVALVLIITRGLTHSMIQPARETLFTLVPRQLRYQGKNAVDTVVWRAGDIVSSLGINALRSLGMNVAGFGVIGALLITISGALGWKLAHRVEKDVQVDA